MEFGSLSSFYFPINNLFGDNRSVTISSANPNSKSNLPANIESKGNSKSPPREVDQRQGEKGEKEKKVLIFFFFFFFPSFCLFHFEEQTTPTHEKNREQKRTEKNREQKRAEKIRLRKQTQKITEQ